MFYPTEKEQQMKTSAQLEAEREDYLRAYYGPQWGAAEEQQLAKIDASLQWAYRREGIPSEDRLSGFEEAAR